MTNAAPAPDCPRLSPHWFFMLYAVNTQAPCLWGGESDTGFAASSRSWFVNKPSLCYKPQCLSAFACRMSGNRNLSGNGCVSKRTSEITKRGETPWGWRHSTGRNSKVLPLGWDLCLIPWPFFLFVELRFTCYVNFVIIDCFTVYSSVAFGAVPYCIAIISQFSSVQSLSRVRLFGTPWTAAHQASLSITNSWSSPRPTSIESVMPSSHLILCRPLLLLPSIFPNIGVFSNESTLCIRWPKYWRFSFNIYLVPNNICHPKRKLYSP